MDETERILTELQDEAECSANLAGSLYHDDPDNDEALKYWERAMSVSDALWEALMTWRVFGDK